MKKYIEYVKEFHNGNQNEIDFINNQLAKHLKEHEENQTEIEHILDFLYSTGRKYKQVWYKTIKEKADAWSKKLQEQASSKDDEIKWEDYSVECDFGDWFKFVRLLSKKAYEREWKLMSHCLGSYNPENSIIYSLRDEKNLPHCTIEENNQIKGKWNGSIHPRYITYAVEFLEHLGMNIRRNEMKNLGYSWIPRKYVRDDVPLFREEYYYWDINDDILRDEYKGKVYFGNFTWNIEERKKSWCIVCLGDFICTNNNLTSLEGAPEIVGGDFDVGRNRLTLLRWAPQKVWGSFDCGRNNITSLQWAPQEVWGDFRCHCNNITSLQWAPKEVFGFFDCSDNNLTDLGWTPQKVGRFNCSSNKLTSLKSAPSEVWGDFYCSYNHLSSLKWAPEIVSGDFECGRNNITSLEWAPKEVWGGFYCYYNHLTDLEWAPQEVWGSFNCSENNLTSLKGAPQEVRGDFKCYNNKLTSLQWAPKEVLVFLNVLTIISLH